MKNVKIYEVKKDAAENAEILLSPNGEHFFWNKKRFNKNDIGDIIFFINKNNSGRWGLYATLSEKNIDPTFLEDKDQTIFEYNNHKYIVRDPNKNYKTFYRFDIKSKVNITGDWNWQKQIGQSEIYDLWRNDKKLNKIQDRIDKIEDLQKLFDNGEAIEILKQTKTELNNSNLFKSEKKAERDNPKLQSDLEKEYRDLLLTIKTKPFIILAGLSGTGKSRLVRTLAFKTCPDTNGLRDDPGKPGNFELIKVRPNWHDSTEVIGYESRISGEDRYIVTDFIRFIVKAWKYPNTPFFLCLDEMNLAPVEQYFAEYLSVFETRNDIGDDKIKTDAIVSSHVFKKYERDNDFLSKLSLQKSEDLKEQFVTEGLTLPKNLIVMGTVNMDETTHSFSKKVLDRAMTIEMNDFDLTAGLNSDINDWSYPEETINPNEVIGSKISGGDVYNDFSKNDDVITFLQDMNEKLAGTPFLATYRVRDEFLIYCYHFSQLDHKPENWLHHALDNITHMKILPKIEGELDQTEHALDGLKQIIGNDSRYPKSRRKIEEMTAKFEYARYTSYWF